MDINFDKSKVSGGVITMALAFGFAISSAFAVGMFVKDQAQASTINSEDIEGLQTQINTINNERASRWDTTNTKIDALNTKVANMDGKLDLLIRLSRR
jgi:TolA-binding protein